MRQNLLINGISSFQKMLNCGLVTLFLMIVVITDTANAEQLPLPPRATPEELKLLPPYCQAIWGENHPNLDYWRQYYGHGFQSFHHYCEALNNMNRYYRRAPLPPGKTVGRWLADALEGFNYMLGSPDPSSPITPELFLNRAIALDLSGQDAGAMKDFYHALELNPKMGKIYSELANFYAKRKMREKALETISQGLRLLPDDKMLQRAYTRYGGKLPYPEPLVKSDAKPTVDESSAPTEKKENTKPLAESRPKPSTVPPPSPPTEQVQPIAGDIKKNPWCRFCPE